MTLRSPSPELLQLGRGIIRLAPHVNGVKMPFRDLGNCEQLTVATADTKLTKNSSRSGVATVYKEIAQERVVTLSITGDEFDGDTLAAILAGEVEVVAASAGGPVVDELHDLQGQKYGQIQLAHPLVSAVVVAQDATTYVLGTDYTIVDAARGIIGIVETGAIDPEEPLEVSYTWAAQSAHRRIKGGTLAVQEATIMFAADNAAGENWDAKFFRVSLSPEGELGLISQEFGQWSFSAKLLDDSAGTFGGSADNPLYQLTEKPSV